MHGWIIVTNLRYLPFFQEFRIGTILGGKGLEKMYNFFYNVLYIIHSF